MHACSLIKSYTYIYEIKIRALMLAILLVHVLYQKLLSPCYTSWDLCICNLNVSHFWSLSWK